MSIFTTIVNAIFFIIFLEGTIRSMREGDRSRTWVTGIMAGVFLLSGLKTGGLI